MKDTRKHTGNDERERQHVEKLSEVTDKHEAVSVLAGAFNIIQKAGLGIKVGVKDGTLWVAIPKVIYRVEKTAKGRALRLYYVGDMEDTTE